MPRESSRARERLAVQATDLEAMKRARDARRAFYGDHTPASSWIGIDRRFVPELMVEIEVVAVLGTPARH